MALLSTFTGVGGESLIRIFTASTTWSPTADIVANVYVVGGGGGGRAGAAGAGGGGGGCAIGYRLNLSSSVTYTITIGAGGQGGWGGLQSDPNVEQYRSSTAGGASSFSGSGITTLTGNGGAAGVSGGGGGSATGGTYNYTGGSSGGTGGLQNQQQRGGVCGLFGTMDGGRGMPFEFGGPISVDAFTNTGDSLAIRFNRTFSGTGLSGGWSLRGENSNQFYPYAGAGGYGAGGGGAYQGQANNIYDCIGGPGGPGFIIIQGVRL